MIASSPTSQNWGKKKEKKERITSILWYLDSLTLTKLFVKNSKISKTKYKIKEENFVMENNKIWMNHQLWLVTGFSLPWLDSLRV
jgi:hypothetical protein